MNELKFGTAGIRGILGEGEAFLNEVHIARIVHGFANYLKDKHSHAQLETKGIVIGYDNRRKSKDFADLSAKILLSYDIKVIYNREITPTPFISFLIKEFETLGAINITASHNPKEYNGLKLYNHFGAQFLPDEMSKIMTFFKSYREHLDYDKKLIYSSKLLNIAGSDKKTKYINQVLKLAGKDCDLSNLTLAYSAQHGTGIYYAPEFFSHLKTKVFYEKCEMIQDQDFKCSEIPSPEEPRAYKNVLQVAREKETDLAVVTDPDADRIGFAVRHDSDYHLISGNEVATILTYFLLENTKEDVLKNKFLAYSFVSSSLPAIMAKKLGLEVFKTEIGFKWIGNLIEIQKSQGKEMILGFEESYGYLLDSNISRDKDAFQALVMVCKIISFYKKENKTLVNVLEEIYQRFGFVISKSISVALSSEVQLERIKLSFKNLNFPNAQFLDYNQGINNISPNNMLAYEFDEGTQYTVRASGTEAKIKFYIFVIGKTKQEAEIKYAKLLEITQKISSIS